jgi:putative ATPase
VIPTRFQPIGGRAYGPVRTAASYTAGVELFPREPAAPRGLPEPSPRAPLAERIRPGRLEDFVGQDHLLGERGALAPVLSGRGQLPSLILWGPPGSGKTTLARLLVERAGLRFVALSAVLAGVRDLRKEVGARHRRLAGRDDREPVVRGDPRAAPPLPHLQPASPRGGRDRAHRAARAR